jgi:uncharacterized protein GlcG (DUF336 family)
MTLQEKNMKLLLRASATAALLALGLASALAQDNGPSVEGVPTAIAIEGAQAAISACAAHGAHISVLVVDGAGLPIAMVSDNGASALTQRLVMSKARIAAKLKMSSAEAATRYKSDDQLMFKLVMDPQMGIPLPGGLPIMVNGESRSAIAVSGASGGLHDEQCTQPGLEKIQQLLAQKAAK